MCAGGAERDVSGAIEKGVRLRGSRELLVKGETLFRWRAMGGGKEGEEMESTGS